ncbi:hypothetical protein SAMN05216238_109103 [Lentibacillus persicus]|uniref:YdhG-like domain-containing protein n=1 Tax=Lentibacillus persicus TaxID=640948 RepID=A0A1I1YGI7_9BACI|nr:DUF1801 domain-containing protein [Lentibacillus persicus]SFE17223.1 hypothetical protein SAMN05216238_109103 [Lentibacillus persicus]
MHNKEVDQFIINSPENIQDIIRQLRKLIFETSPNITEEMKWGKPCYIENGLVCYLQTAKQHVNLGFYFGAHLKDKDNLLQGSGKKMRHIRVNQLNDIQPEQFSALIREAIELET